MVHLQSRSVQIERRILRLGLHRKYAVCGLLISVLVFHRVIFWSGSHLFAMIWSLIVFFLLMLNFEYLTKGSDALVSIQRKRHMFSKRNAGTDKDDIFLEQVCSSIRSNTCVLWSWSVFLAICCLINRVFAGVVPFGFQCKITVVLGFSALAVLLLSSWFVQRGRLPHFGVLFEHREEHEMRLLKLILFKFFQLIFVGPLIAIICGQIWLVRRGATILFDLCSSASISHFRENIALWATVLAFPLTLFITMLGRRILLISWPEQLSVRLSELSYRVYQNFQRRKQFTSLIVGWKRFVLLSAIIPLVVIATELSVFRFVVEHASFSLSVHNDYKCPFPSIQQMDTNRMIENTDLFDVKRSSCTERPEIVSELHAFLVNHVESQQDLSRIASDVNREMDRKLAVVDLSPTYAEEMIATWRDRTNHELVRNFAVQHLERYARECVVRGTWDPASADAADVRAALEEAVLEAGTSVGGAALLALARLSEIDPDVDRARLGARASSLVSDLSAPAANRASAAQVCGLLRVRSALPALRSLSSDSSVPTPLRLAAQHAAEEIEGR